MSGVLPARNILPCLELPIRVVFMNIFQPTRNIFQVGLVSRDASCHLKTIICVINLEFYLLRGAAKGSHSKKSLHTLLGKGKSDPVVPSVSFLVLTKRMGLERTMPVPRKAILGFDLKIFFAARLQYNPSGNGLHQVIFTSEI